MIWAYYQPISYLLQGEFYKRNHLEFGGRIFIEGNGGFNLSNYGFWPQCVGVRSYSPLTHKQISGLLFLLGLDYNNHNVTVEIKT
jgi:hypothetical protein